MDKVISRKGFLKGAAAMAGAATLAAAPRVSEAQTSRRPDVFLALTDDQPYHTLPQMVDPVSRPNGMARMLREGTDYSPKGYAILPLCGPMRASLFTGLCPHNHRALDNETAFGTYRARRLYENDLFHRMKRAGYRIGFFGKFINGIGPNTGPDGQGFVHPAFVRGRDRWCAIVDREHQGTGFRVNLDGTLRDVTEHQSTFLSNQAVAWVKANATSTQPLFVYLPLTDPHGPYTPSAAFVNAHNGVTYVSPGVEEDTPEELVDQPRWIRDQGGTPASEHRFRYEGIREEILDADLAIHRVTEAFAANRSIANTLRIMSADNGYFLGEHGGLTAKGEPLEEASRVPFVVAGPGFPAGVSGRHLVSHLDITATVLHAGNAPGANLDGRPLQKLVANPRVWRKRLLVEHPLEGWYGLREEDPEGDWSYFEFPAGERALYELSSDPYQTRNLSGEPAQAARISDFAAKLARLKSATTDRFRAAEEEEEEEE